MKNTIKLLFLGLFLFGITATRAQISTSTGGAANVLANVPTSNTNVGIGTTNPTNALTVQKVSGGIGVSGTDGTGGVRVNWSSGYGVALDAWDGNEPKWGITSFFGNTPTVILEGKYSSKDAYFNSGGNVGIGTTTPSEKLVVRGDGARIRIESSSSPSSYYAFLESKYDAANPFNIVVQGTQMFGSKNIGISNTPDTYVSGFYGIAFATQTTTTENANVRMYINQAGKVGIGTTNPDEKLTVKGKIHAEEIKVDLAVPADYVFQKYYTGKSELKSDYCLPTLAEIETFTKQNHHLPNIPSAKDIQQNGVSLGEMSNVLLQKIEELTLYAIEQQKELERLKTENENYKSLATRLSAIEKELKR